jgi:hypothetical protein
MSRFSVQAKSATALAVDTGFAWLYPVTANGYKLRRMTLGVVAGATTPTSQQVTVGINRTTNAGTTPGGGMTPGKLDPNSSAAGSVFSTTFGTPPTLTANDQYRVTFNSQSGVDLPWEPPVPPQASRSSTGTTPCPPPTPTSCRWSSRSNQPGRSSWSFAH